MTPQNQERLSKHLTPVPCHRPEIGGRAQDAGGWVDVGGLLDGLRAAGQDITRDPLAVVVAENHKKRFIFSKDKAPIRASPGHPFTAEHAPTAQVPPFDLFHGTATKSVVSIWRHGLVCGARQRVHLSCDIETATQVGQRHADPVIFRVDTDAMVQADHQFFVADNGVWLTDHVPARFLVQLSDDDRKAVT